MEYSPPPPLRNIFQSNKIKELKLIKNIYGIDNKNEHNNEDALKYDDHQSMLWPFSSIKNEENQDDNEDTPCCSSKIKYKLEDDTSYHDPILVKKIKTEFEPYKIDQHKKNENLIDVFQSDSSVNSSENKMSSLKHVHPSVTNFYQYKINYFIQFLTREKDTSVISQSMYDYKRVKFNGFSKTDQMFIEVSNKHLTSFDPSLSTSSSLPYISDKSDRKSFQMAIKKEIDNKIKELYLSKFLELSLGKKSGDDNSYISWKNSIADELSSISVDIKKEILKESKKKCLGRTSSGFSFEKRCLRFFGHMLIKEIMRHALFSICIQVRGNKKRLLVARARMACLFNRYSDCFIQALDQEKEEKYSIKMIKEPYFSWKKSKNQFIKEATNAARTKFISLFQSDQKIIREKIFILEKTGFRPLMNDEFEGLLNFIKNLLDFKGRSGIIERACYYFHKKESYNALPISLEHPKLEIGEKSSPMIECGKRENEKPIEKINYFEIAGHYCQLIRNFLRNLGIEDDSLIANGLYDYKRVRWSSHNLSVESFKKREIEVTNECLILIDPSFKRGFFNSHPLSNNLSKRRFQEGLKEKIDKKLRESIFLEFVEMSIHQKTKQEKKTYSSWKESISRKLDILSVDLIQDILKESKKNKKISLFIDRYFSFCKKLLIKEVLRHALFSIPSESEKYPNRIFVSRAELSYFFNKYAGYFLSKFLENGNPKKDLTEKPRSSYTLWRKSRDEKISDVVASFQLSIRSVVEQDRDELRKKVLVFGSGGFRPMTDSELQAITTLIYQLVESKGSLCLVERALRHLYREYIWEGSKSTLSPF